jgi:hypothetical protein
MSDLQIAQVAHRAPQPRDGVKLAIDSDQVGIQGLGQCYVHGGIGPRVLPHLPDPGQQGHVTLPLNIHAAEQVECPSGFVSGPLAAQHETSQG